MNAALEFFAPDFLIPALGRARIGTPTEESLVDSLEAERRGTAQLLEQAVDLGAIVTEFPVVAAIQPLDLEVQFALFVVDHVHRYPGSALIGTVKRADEGVFLGR